MKTKIAIAGPLAIAAILSACTENIDNRQDRRDDRQDCRKEEGIFGGDKRDCKQEERTADAAS